MSDYICPCVECAAWRSRNPLAMCLPRHTVPAEPIAPESSYALVEPASAFPAEPTRVDLQPFPDLTQHLRNLLVIIDKIGGYMKPEHQEMLYAARQAVKR